MRIYLELNEAELRLPGLLVDQVVVVLGWDVERVPLLCVELKTGDFSIIWWDFEVFHAAKSKINNNNLGGVQDDRDLSFENNKHHGVLVSAAHPLRGVTLDPEINIIENRNTETSFDIFLGQRS